MSIFYPIDGLPAEAAVHTKANIYSSMLKSSQKYFKASSGSCEHRILPAGTKHAGGRLKAAPYNPYYFHWRWPWISFLGPRQVCFKKQPLFSVPT